MTDFALAIDRLPDSFKEAVETSWHEFETSPIGETVNAKDLAGSLPRVWSTSGFVTDACLSRPDLLVDLVDSRDLFVRYSADGLKFRLEERLRDLASPEDLALALRRFRLREMVRIAWRDLGGMSELEETLGDLTRLAEACLDGALARIHSWECSRYGTPRDASGSEQRLVVLGMGKLGGGELNFSSDIDLIFVYPSPGQTDGRRAIDNEEFFRRVGQKLIKALDEQTTDGRVFRVDMRLRPFGQSGPLAMHFDACEHYYQIHGREWERYAMVKARPVAGDQEAGKRLMKSLEPFVYRRYLDYSAVDSLREMKALIAHEVERKGMERNFKLGPGGIREIEFIAQMFQLVYGGRRPGLRVRGTLPALDAIASQRLLPDYAVSALEKAYRFLRLTENRLQAQADRQVHELPSDDKGKARLAFAMGFEQWGHFVKALMGHVRRVEDQFGQVFSVPQSDVQPVSGSMDFSVLWRRGVAEGDDQHRDLLLEQGYREPERVVELLERLRSSYAVRSMSKNGRARLDQLMPLALGAAAQKGEPEVTLARVLGLFEGVARRSVYLSLLVENPLALSQLVKLCGASPWIAEYLGKHPLLLDELLQPGTLYEPLVPEALAAEAAEFVSRVPEGDLERGMDELRHFQQTNVLRVAAADVAGVLPLMIVSDHLTWIAEAVLRQVVDMAWRDLSGRLGTPTYAVDGNVAEAGFAVVAYGKLGGIELGYGSDLDLVFLHDSCGERQQTNGAKQVDNVVFFVRLAQRIIHILSTQTTAGVLYEADTRLRPSGASGLLVTSIDAFADYQRKDAWTWEHQALVRARVVVGPDKLLERFRAIRAEILGQARDPAALRVEVLEMRERMRSELGSSQVGRFSLKQDRGGIVDIEFMVQYAVLAGAGEFPELLEWTDNIRQLDALQAVGLFTEEDARFLRDAYRALRRQGHRLELQARSSHLELEAADDELVRFRDGIECIWQRLMETS